MTQLLNSWEMLFVQTNLGVVDEAFPRSKSIRYTQMVAFPGVRTWWNRSGKEAYVSEFVKYVDARLDALDDTA